MIAILTKKFRTAKFYPGFDLAFLVPEVTRELSEVKAECEYDLIKYFQTSRPTFGADRGMLASEVNKPKNQEGIDGLSQILQTSAGAAIALFPPARDVVHPDFPNEVITPTQSSNGLNNISYSPQLKLR